jgi:hypothetical protein
VPPSKVGYTGTGAAAAPIASKATAANINKSFIFTSSCFIFLPGTRKALRLNQGSFNAPAVGYHAKQALSYTAVRLSTSQSSYELLVIQNEMLWLRGYKVLGN